MYKYSNSMLPGMFDNFFATLKIHTRIVIFNPKQNNYMLI